MAELPQGAVVAGCRVEAVVGPRRHGRGLPGDAAVARAAGRAEGDRAGAGRRRHVSGALQARVADRRVDRAPERDPGLRGRRGRGAAVPDHALRRGDGPAGADRLGGRARAGTGGADRGAGGGRAGGGAPARPDPQGREAGERADRRGRRARPRVPDGLRHRAPCGGDVGADPDGVGDRNARLPGAGADPGPGRRRPRGRVRAGLRAVRDADGNAAVRARQRRGEDVRALERAGAIGARSG